MLEDGEILEKAIGLQRKTMTLELVPGWLERNLGSHLISAKRH